MTNNFSTKKELPATKKIILARIKPGREISFDLSVVTGTLYQMTFPYETLCGVEVNGIVFTLVTGTPSTNEYSFSGTTRLLQIELSAALAFFQAAGAIVANYYLFYTNDIGRYITQDPEDSSTSIRFWEPRIKGFPGFEVSQEDIIDGFLSIGNSSLSLSNEDSDFQQYLTEDDSFSKKEIKMWQCLDETMNIAKLFSGVCAKLTLSPTSVNISTDNLFGVLDNKYSAFTTLDDSTYRGSGLTVRDEDKDRSILRLFCLVTKTVEMPSDWQNTGILIHAVSGQAYYLFTQACNAVNVSYSATQSTTANRDWAACKESSASSQLSETLAGKTASVISGITLTRFTVANANKYRPGDNVKINGSVGFYVIEIDITNNYIFILNATGVSNGQTIIRPSISVVQIKAQNDSGIQYYANLEWETHYTIKASGGIRIIDLNDNFESAFVFTGDIVNGILPDNEVLFRAWNHDSIEHGDVVKSILESAGLTVDTASITAANLTSFQANFTLPYWSEDTSPTYQEALEKILTSTFGHLSLGNDFEVEYNVFETPAPAVDITEAELINNSLIQEIDYKDIYTSFEFSNEHGENIFNDRLKNARWLTTTEAAVYNSRAKFLYGIDKAKKIEHVLLNMTNSKDKIAGLLSKRRLTMTLTTKGINFESIVGDDFTIQSNKVVGPSGEVDAKILSIEKKPNETTIKLTDLLGIP